MNLARIYFFCLCTLFQWQVVNAQMSKLEQQTSLYEEPYISVKYRRGEHLIYDCIKRHFLCVNINGFENCKIERDVAKDKKRLNLKCSPLKKFKTQAACSKSAYQQIHNIKTKGFCIGKRKIQIN